MSPASRLFGTDGIRGVAGQPPLTPATVFAVGQAMGELLAVRRGRRPVVLLAGDTRPSTPQIARWLASGLAAAGAGVRWAGILPTPAVALLVRQMSIDAGIAVSASHNPAADNGIKMFDRRGCKWSREREEALEALVRTRPAGAVSDAELPRCEATAANRYLDYLVGMLPSPDALTGLRVAIDGAHGAAAPLLAELSGRLGLEATLLHATPEGERINDGCGSTHPEVVAESMLRQGAELGFTLDGDADRVLLADATGRVWDGDALLYLWARDLRRRGELEPPRIVATTMSNLGLERSLNRLGIEVVRCDVGDREVATALEREGLILGGEQSGHILNRALSTTGDGLLTALQIAAIVRAAQAPLDELLADFEVFPQVLRNVRVRHRVPFDALPAVQAARDAVAAELDGQGRLLLRYSGTEPLARVMIEGPEQPMIERLADRLVAAIEEALGPPAA